LFAGTLASLQGIATDQNGERVQGVEIKLIDQDTKALIKETTTNEQGRYFFFSLKPGLYALDVWYQGVHQQHIDSILLSVADRLRVDVTIDTTKAP